MINDHTIQSFSKVPETRVQQQSLLEEMISLLVMLTINVFNGHRMDILKQRKNLITPMTQRWYI